MKHSATSNFRLIRSGGGAVLLAILAGGLTGCAETNYRTEVIPTGEGTVDVRQVPKPPAPPQPDVPPQKPLDPDLAQIEQLWPTLSPADRKTVLDLTHRLSGTP